MGLLTTGSVVAVDAAYNLLNQQSGWYQQSGSGIATYYQSYLGLGTEPSQPKPNDEKQWLRDRIAETCWPTR